MARGRRIIQDSSDEDFPDVQDMGSWNPKSSKQSSSNSNAAVTPAATAKLEQSAKNATTVRRRKLGAITDNALLRPFGDSLSSTHSQTPIKEQEVGPRKKTTTPQRIELRTRKTKHALTSPELGSDHSEAESIQEETILEDFSEEDDGSEFDENECSDIESDDSALNEILQRSRSNPRKINFGGRKRSTSPSAQLLAEALEAGHRDNKQGSSGKRTQPKEKAPTKKAEGSRRSPLTDIDDPLSKLRV